MDIHRVGTDDAEQYLALCRQIEAEREVSLVQPGEGPQTVEEQASQIGWIRESPNSELLVALSEGEWVGYVMALGGTYHVDAHSALVVVEVVASMRRKGAGSRLMMELEFWAREISLHRLELTVLASNEAAIQFYFKLGYEREGVKRHARLIGGEYVDEWLMAKIL